MWGVEWEDRIALLLTAVTWIQAPEDAWKQVAELRFALLRQGSSAHIIDLLIAVTAFLNGHSVLTRDRDFSRIAALLPIEVAIF